MDSLERYFRNNAGHLIHKWHHYFEIYERHFARFRDREVNVLEFGVWHGGSLQMWKNYFGPRARIYGVDIEPACKSLEEERIEIHIGDQGDRKFLRSLRSSLPRIDILIDDGGHTMAQQITTFEELFDDISDEGVYLCEDTHTSYWPEYGGGLRRPGSYMEYAKRLIDQLNAWHTREPGFAPDDFTLSARSIHFYDSVVVIEKHLMEPPRHSKTGSPSF